MIVVFDVDGTLLKSDSLFLAAKKSRSIIGFFVSSISFIPLIIPWKLKLISDEKIKEKFIKSFVKNLMKKKRKVIKIGF